MNVSSTIRWVRSILTVVAVVALRAFVIALIAPWICGALIRRGVRAFRAAARFALALRLVRARELSCPQGHRSLLLGVFECRTCGALFAGWVFGACPTCGESCGYVSCEHCGLAVRNPFV